MRLREQRKSNLAPALQRITPLKCAPICDKSHHPWKSCSCSTQGRGTEKKNHIRPIIRSGKHPQRESTCKHLGCVIPANSEACGHLGALMGLCPDVVRARSGFRSSSLPLCCRAPVAACQLLCYRKLRGGIKPWLPPSLSMDLVKGHKQT